jgi:ubiquinone/menaquinone biosynthesis C-methylase UbiE
MSKNIQYICPLCKSGRLILLKNAYKCGCCEKEYKIISEIPDFRIYPFPYSANEDSEVRILLDNYDRLDFLSLYKLRQSFFLDKNKSKDSLRKAEELHALSLKNLLGYHMDHSDVFSTNMKRFWAIIGKRINHGKEMSLELGCGRGTQIPDMLSIYKNVIAIDNSFSELIVTKKLLNQKKIAEKVCLVCACSESLPFMEKSFDAINMRSVLEHVEDQRSSLCEVHRVMRTGSILLLEIPNRFTFREEPHVKIYGVGFMPRRWMKGYVDLVTRKQLTFGGIRTLSYFELKALIKMIFGTQWEHRARLIDESRPGVTFIGKLYRKSRIFKKIVENIFVKFFCETHYLAIWK